MSILQKFEFLNLSIITEIDCFGQFHNMIEHETKLIVERSINTNEISIFNFVAEDLDNNCRICISHSTLNNRIWNLTHCTNADIYLT